MGTKDQFEAFAMIVHKNNTWLTFLFFLPTFFLASALIAIALNIW